MCVVFLLLISRCHAELKSLRISINSINRASADDMAFCVLIDTLQANFHNFYKIIILIKIFLHRNFYLVCLCFRVGATSHDNFHVVPFSAPSMGKFFKIYLISSFLTNEHF